MTAPHPDSGPGTPAARRSFLKTSSTLAMGGGLVASYGTLGVMAGRFLYPSGGAVVAWQFVATVDELGEGSAMEYVAPSGAKVVIARQGPGSSEADFVALSSVCPHLGCQVHWEPQNSRFFCPCHNGAFDARGAATEGPPAKARQQLLRFPLKVENGLLYIEVPMESIARTDRAGASLAEREHPRQGGMA